MQARVKNTAKHEYNNVLMHFFPPLYSFLEILHIQISSHLPAIAHSVLSALEVQPYEGTDAENNIGNVILCKSWTFKLPSVLSKTRAVFAAIRLNKAWLRQIHQEQCSPCLLGPALHELFHRLLGGLFKHVPEIPCGSVLVLVVCDVATHAVSKHLWSQVGMKHAHNRAALAIGDCIENL